MSFTLLEFDMFPCFEHLIENKRLRSSIVDLFQVLFLILLTCFIYFIYYCVIVLFLGDSMFSLLVGFSRNPSGLIIFHVLFLMFYFHDCSNMFLDKTHLRHNHNNYKKKMKSSPTD